MVLVLALAGGLCFFHLQGFQVAQVAQVGTAGRRHRGCEDRQ